MATETSIKSRPSDPSESNSPWVWITKEAHNRILAGFEDVDVCPSYGLAIYLSLVRLANDKDHSTKSSIEVSMGLIASQAGGISKKTVQRVVRVLEELQLVTVKRGRKSKEGSPLANRFTLLEPPCSIAQKGSVPESPPPPPQSSGMVSESRGMDSADSGAKSNFLKNSNNKNNKNNPTKKPPRPKQQQQQKGGGW